MSGENVKHVTDLDFDSVTSSHLPVLVYFWAPWCGPCKAIAPVVDELADEFKGKAVIAKMNMTENETIAERLGIKGIPAVVMFRNKQELERVTDHNEDSYRAAIKRATPAPVIIKPVKPKKPGFFSSIFDTPAEKNKTWPLQGQRGFGQPTGPKELYPYQITSLSDLLQRADKQVIFVDSKGDKLTLRNVIHNPADNSLIINLDVVEKEKAKTIKK